MVPIHPTGHRLKGTNKKCHCQLDVSREVLELYPRTTPRYCGWSFQDAVQELKLFWVGTSGTGG